MYTCAASLIGSVASFSFDKEVSDHAKTIRKMFEGNTIGEEFFDSVQMWFESYDQQNQCNNRKNFLNDVEFIIQNVTDTLKMCKSPTLVSERVDGYLYMLSRIVEYLSLQHQPIDRTTGFRKLLFEHLGTDFKSSKGTIPNLQLKEKEKLQKIDIKQFFGWFADVDSVPKLLQFFAICKLAFQSSEVVDESSRLRWKDILTMTKQWKISLFEFVKEYILYKQIFAQSPFDAPAFVNLLKMSPSELKQLTAFEKIRDLFSKAKLALDYNDFYIEYQTLFSEQVKQRYYSEQYIATFLVGHQDNEDMFGTYLQLYASNTSFDDLWNTFLYFSREFKLNEIIERHLISKLIQKIETTRKLDMFSYCCQSLQNSIKLIPSKKYARVSRILQDVFHVILRKKIYLSGCVFLLPDNDAKELLNILLTFSWSINSSSSSCLFLVEHLIFILHYYTKDQFERLYYLFQRLNMLNETICSKNKPEKIIKDNWLTDYFQFTLYDLLKTNRDGYRTLCDIHQNNRWSLFIWSKLVYFSAVNIDANHLNEILGRMNQWIVEVQHDKYQNNDPLTTILINNVFECMIFKNSKLALSLPDIQPMIRYILDARDAASQWIDRSKVDEFIDITQQSIRSVLLLEGTSNIYRRLSNPSIVPCILPLIDLKSILSKIDSSKYKFVTTAPHINKIMDLKNPADINIPEIEFKVEGFRNLINQANVWLDWFEKFIDIFLYVTEWLKNCKMERADEFYLRMCDTRTDSTMTLFNIKQLIQEVLHVFEHCNHLLRLCDLFNCTQWFHCINPWTLSNPEQHKLFIAETKRFRPNDIFKMNANTWDEKLHSIDDRRRVRWSLAYEQYLHHIVIEYRLSGSSNEVYKLCDMKNISPDQGVLRGEFKTQRGGTLRMGFQNSNEHTQQTIWFQIQSNPLSTCHLFHGIFRTEYKKCFNLSNTTIKQKDLWKLMDRVFSFIDNLLDGNITLAEMDELRTVFYDKNINVREEVQILFANRSITNDTTSRDKIEQVYKWLKTYEYYSHVNIIVDCLQKFEIISTGTSDESMNNLLSLKIDNNWSLKDISKTYDDVYRRFEKLSSKHLQLIRTMVACPNVIDMMKKSQLYSPDGLRRFQELRDNLTTQFQLQEWNNTILNSWIISFTLCEPFVHNAYDLEQFVDNLSRLTLIDENSCEHIKTMNKNIQTINLWLSMDDTTMLDNALIMMEHLYKTGVVNIRLRRLVNERSHYDIDYCIDKISDPATRTNTSSIQQEQIRYSLPMVDIDDHRRQLTFCTSDLLADMPYKTLLLTEQLKLLQIIDKIFSMTVKLEISGHPEYQCMDEHYEIYDVHGHIKKILTNMKDESAQYLQEIIIKRTKHFESISNRLVSDYDRWIEGLEKYRLDNPLLTLFSNRQITIMILLLTVPTDSNSIQQLFLEKVFFCKQLPNYKRNQSKWAIECLTHYLQSIKMTDCDMSEQNINQLYDQHRINAGSKTDTSLKALSKFLRELFYDGRELLSKNTVLVENQQYIVKFNSNEQQTDDNNDFDRDMYCILLNIFHDRLPADYQILWCSSVTQEDIRLFFSRVRIFPTLTFAVIDIGKMHDRPRTFLWQEQDSLANQHEPHGRIYYFTKELISGRKGLRPFFVPPLYRNPAETYSRLMRLVHDQHINVPQIDIVYGVAGIGKTHSIRNKNHENNLSCISINDKLNLTSLISTFLSLESNVSNSERLLYLNVSIHAPFDQLNRTLFSLFICRSLNDAASGLTFSLALRQTWKYIIEVPYAKICKPTPIKHFETIFPILSIISPKNLTEVTNENHQLSIGKDEELVARFLKAYENGSINRLAVPNTDNYTYDDEQPVDFDHITDNDEAREYIYDCLETNAPDLPKNKIFQLSFTKFLYRRVRFFTEPFYRYNSSVPYLGSIAITQMIQEATHLTQGNFDSDDYHRIYLVYDPGFALHILHNDWDAVPMSIKSLFKNSDPMKGVQSSGKNYFIKCLSWLIDISYETFEKLMNKTKFILTENFTYKLFHIHERKLTKLPLIIEGQTGVGKTFLLKFYSSLLNANISHGELYEKTTPRILERISLWLSKKIIGNILERDLDFLTAFLQQIETRLNNLHENKNDAAEEENKLLISLDEDKAQSNDKSNILSDIKHSLQEYQYDQEKLKIIWKTILNIADERDKHLVNELIVALYDFITSQLENLPLIEASWPLKKLIEEKNSSSVEKSIEMFIEFVVHTRVKSVFYRLLVHPGVTEEKIVEFISPIYNLATQVPNIELVVFFDEVNTSSCLGLLKEMFMDGTLHGKTLPKNIFFTAAINPSTDEKNNTDHTGIQIHRRDYLVHKLPEALENLKVSYGILDRNTLEDYIKQKIATFTVGSTEDSQKQLPLEQYAQQMLMKSILSAQNFCEKHLGSNSVSQREIQRCFNLIDFFWKLKYDDENDKPDALRCIALSLALIYYFRLPTKEDNNQRNDSNTPSREDFAEVLDRTLPDFVDVVQNELNKFVNTKNFVIPPGVAINQAILEHSFAIVVSVVTRIPLSIIGDPGQSKTLSFQIVLQNLQGSQLSSTSFCRRLPALDPFFCLGSKYTRSEEIAYVFDRAIQREEQYKKICIDRRCVVFLDEASLPDEKKMVLKVLHPYLDECQVSFVAIANKSFDPANANRMICIYRSLPSPSDQQVLAYGCLGLPLNKNLIQTKNHLDNIIIGLCEGYRKLLASEDIPPLFHDRDFIYMLRELRFELPINTADEEEEEATLNAIQPIALLRALEDNFNGIDPSQFKSLVNLFFQAVKARSPHFLLPTGRQHSQNVYRDVPSILHESMKLDSRRRRLYGRYKLIIDESEDDSAIHLLLQMGILDSDRSRTTVFRMSDFVDDSDNELRNVEILSNIKLCMETGKTILMVNTSRIHGSLYDVFNQNFSIMATGDTRKIFSKVSIGAKTIDVVVHEGFQCIVHVKRNELHTIPAPFLSRFQKYSLSINDFYRIRVQKLPKTEQEMLQYVEKKTQSFIEHFGRQYFYGLNDNTIYSCLLSLIEMKSNGEYSLFNVSHHYTQLTIRMKSLIEPNPSDIQQCLLRTVLVKLIQLVSPESIILKLRTFEEKFAQWLSNLYFQEQEHFNIENFVQRLISESISSQTNDEQKLHRTTKVMIFTRTSSYILSMNQRSKHNFLKNNIHDDESQPLYVHKKRIEILNLSTIENSSQLQEKFDQFRDDQQKSIFIIIIDTHLHQQRLHIPFIRYLIDNTEYTCNADNNTKRKYFIMLIHSPAQHLYHQSCFPAIFLHQWDFHFFDTCAAGSAFYLHKLLQLLSSSSSKQDNALCDLNVLFEDCLWDFCSRIQITAPNLRNDMFTDRFVHEFYQRETDTMRRVKCLRQIVQQSSELQKLLVDIYQQHLSGTKNSSEKINDFVYQISKDILCGKRFDGLVESILTQTRYSFINFVSNIFKIIVNDYGLEGISQLTKNQLNYRALFDLIDFQSFAVEDENEIFASQTTQSTIQFVTNYSCVPQTPLFHLFHQRIKSHANTIKLKYIRHDVESQSNSNASMVDRDEYSTTTERTFNDENETGSLTFERFRSELINSIRNDRLINDAINSSLVQTYSTDLVRTICAVIENNFDRTSNEYKQTVEFISKWLSSVDKSNYPSIEDETEQCLFFLAQVYTTFEYEQTDILSMYVACRIMYRLGSMQSILENLFVDPSVSRSDLQDIFFRSIFDQLWDNLNQSFSQKENYQKWVHTYVFISKYYPSEKVLHGMQLSEIRCQIELMDLVYLIFLNEKIPEPHNLVANLLKGIQLNTRSNCLTLLPSFIEIIYQYIKNKKLEDFTLMIDMQQWIIAIFKSYTQPSEEVIRSLLTYLNEITNKISLAMKQILFDQLVELILQMKQTSKSRIDLWDRFNLIPILIDCISKTDQLEHYQVPFHPSIVTADEYQAIKVPLFDLYFVHLRTQMKHESITSKFLNKGMLLKLSKIANEAKVSMAENLFKQFKNYFLSTAMGHLLCSTDLNQEDENQVHTIFSTLIQDLLSVDSTSLQLNKYLQVFLSIIISKHSWHYLFEFLQSEKIRSINETWTTTLCRLLQSNETVSQNSQIRLSQEIQFTFSSNSNGSSIFPCLHQSYKELRKSMSALVHSDADEEAAVDTFASWLHDQIGFQSGSLQSSQFKAMLLLHIYYDYYCTNQLESIRPLTNGLTELLSTEELQVFRVLLDPEEYMVGYNYDDNSLNNLFKLNCQSEFDLSLRHMLVNLMAMILLGGEKSFLWAFAFKPSSLANTFGFGSTYPAPIQEHGVHYDCGCVITENGALKYPYGRDYNNVLDVPAAYVAYFSTFGALAWHLLLDDESVENLHGPILSPTAIGDQEAAYRQAGDSVRAKTCHFVMARLLSSFHFLSLRSNLEDSCILLTRCFERMAYLTVKDNQRWIKPVYTRLDVKFKAEEHFQNNVFFYVFDKLAEYKADINERILQSQIQCDLQQFVDEMPLILDYQHFQLALNRSNTQSSYSLRILRCILDSFDILKVLKLITHLARFYLLLHQNYTQLIRTDEFYTITLKELYERAGKRSNQSYTSYTQSEKEDHQAIIDRGIESVNTYHQFSNGFIRPGACDQTQRFEPINFDVPVNYLLTIENQDEGNIILRILSILVDYHNHILDLLQKEVNNNKNYHDSILSLLVNKITSKEISVLQVANYDIGIITLNEDDDEWIRRLCLASLQSNKEHVFINNNTSFTFDFEYVQSQIIRTYLLLCRINYQHIVHKYQFYTPQISGNSTTVDNENLNLNETFMVPFDDEELQNEWSYLKTISLDNLYHSYTLLKQIAVTLKTYPDNVLSSRSIFNFVQSTDTDNEILQQMQQYGIKDFLLCHYNHVIKLYIQSMNGLEHLFNDVPPLLRIRIDSELNTRLIEQLNENLLKVDYDNDIDKIKNMIQMITQLLNDLKNSVDHILQRSSQPFVETCGYLAIENPILEWIPKEILCENYVPLNIHLVQIRSSLQEQKVNIEERTVVLWQEETNEPEKPDESYPDDPSKTSESENETDQSAPSSPPPVLDETHDFEESCLYSSIFKLDMKLVPFSSSNFLQQLHEYRIEANAESSTVLKYPKFTVILPDGKLPPFMCRVDKFQERLKKIFDDRKYNYDQYVVVDNNQIFIDIIKKELQPSQILSNEYRIVEEKDLIHVEFQFRSSVVEYLTTPLNQISTVIKHFINVNCTKDMTSHTYLHFFDRYGACIEDVSIEHLYGKEDKRLTIIVKEKTLTDITLCAIKLSAADSDDQQVFLFDSETAWQQIELWLKNLSSNDFAFFSPEQQIILEKNQMISSTIDSNQSNSIDVINQQMITSITLSYENNSQTLLVFKTMKIISLLKNENLRQKLHIVNSEFDNYAMVLEKKENCLTLTRNEIEQLIETYCTGENELLHFRLFILTSIKIYHNQEEFSVTLSTKNIIIHEMFQLFDNPTNASQRLALKETKRVLDDNEMVSNLSGHEFLLVDKKETCYVSVESTETTFGKYFVNHATIADVCKELQINVDNQYLLYSNEIIPSTNTPLSYFQSDISIHFNITETNLPVVVIITDNQQSKIVEFKCAVSTSIEHLCSISCRLLRVLDTGAELALTDGTIVDKDMSLTDIDEEMDKVEFQLIAAPCLSCSITCSDHTIVFACQPEQLILSLINEMFDKLSISHDQIDSYELFALDTDETQIDFDISINDIKELFSSTQFATIAVELRKP